MSATTGTPVPAASVLLMRPATVGIEVLYLRRNPALAFRGGYWVFPGGRIDPQDCRPEVPRDSEAAARRAAVREAREEAGVRLSAASLVFATHWTTPVDSPIRFATSYFVAPAPAGRIRVDGGEIHAYRWLRPGDALARFRAGEIKLAEPTFGLTARVAVFADVATALTTVAAWPKERLVGELRDVEGGRVAIYDRDAARGGGPLDRPGPRHRLWMVASGWRYERDL